MGGAVGPGVAVTTTVWMTGVGLASGVGVTITVTIDSVEQPRTVSASNIAKQNTVDRPIKPPSYCVDFTLRLERTGWGNASGGMVGPVVGPLAKFVLSHYAVAVPLGFIGTTVSQREA